MADSSAEKKRSKWDQAADPAAAAAAALSTIPSGTSPAAIAAAAAVAASLAAAGKPVPTGTSLLGMPGMLSGQIPGLNVGSAGPGPAVPNLDDAKARAEMMARQVNEELAKRGIGVQRKPEAAAAGPPGKPLAEEIVREVVINECNPNVRYQLTRRGTQDDIHRKTGAVISTRGKFCNMNDPKNRDRPLYLHVTPSTEAKTPEEKQRMVDAAVRMIDDIMNRRPGEQASEPQRDRADPGRPPWRDDRSRSSRDSRAGGGGRHERDFEAGRGREIRAVWEE
ncbi:hypothetical protein CLOP_g7318 [Closterium sp. NIES-67]|nr:hypothetical protein CLOP_g7318 [Closterium sp. NIES-67]